VAKESLVHERSTPAMRHIDFIFIPDRLPHRVREEVSGLKERFHPSPYPTPPTSRPRVEARPARSRIERKFCPTEKFVTMRFHLRLEAEKNVSKT